MLKNRFVMRIQIIYISVQVVRNLVVECVECNQSFASKPESNKARDCIPDALSPKLNFWIPDCYEAFPHFY